MHQEAMSAVHADLERKRLDWLDVQAEQAEKADSRRKSVAMRLNEWRDQRIAEEVGDHN
jgi:hypothetical protein